LLPTLIEVTYKGGVHVPELDLWLDPHGARERAFVSHAHFDHFAPHARMICSSPTASIAHRRFRIARARIEGHPFREAWEEHGFRIELLPAGHIFGSAMIHLTRLEDGATLLYTGDFKMRPGLTAEPPELLPADLFITETTFGLPKYVFPPEDEIHRNIMHFVRSALEDGEVPVLLGYSLGKAQEAVALLEQAGVRCVQHKTVAVMTDACRQAGLELAEPIIFETSVPDGHALVCPPNAVRSQALRRLKRKRTAMLTGWAMHANAHYRFMTDTAFPLSDHADHPGLLAAVAQVRPKQVLTLHGSAREFAAELRSMGIEAWSVFGNDQMELDVGGGVELTNLKTHKRPPCKLAGFSDLLATVEDTAGKLEKVRAIAGHLRGLPDDDLALAATWLTGRAFGRGHQHRHLKMGPALIRQALLEATGLPLSRYKTLSATQNESARTARLLLEEAALSPEPMTLGDVARLLERLAGASGALERTALLAATFRTLHPVESASLVRILTGELRVGSKEGLLEDAVAEAFRRPAKAVREAHMLTGDLGKVALLAKADRLPEARLTPLVPVKVMLASPEETAEAIFEHMGGEEFWLEDKFDGIRAQLHKRGDEVALFSRDLRSLDEEFPELLDNVRGMHGDFILDGEIIAHAAGKRLTFHDLQRRLGRVKGQGDLFLGNQVPVRFVAFDMLHDAGLDLLKTPLEERRKHLDRLEPSTLLEVIAVTKARSADAINAAFKRAKRNGNEGLIAKEAGSTYCPGRRGRSWLKLKKAMPTLDCVVVKAQQGHGRRSGVLSDYTFAVRDAASGSLVVIGKAYSGLTDLEIEELTEHFKAHTLEKSRRVHTVEPNVVLEIAFDAIRKSGRHESGLAMRFPRIKAIRRDKTVNDVDTLEDARSLLDEQTGAES